MRGISMRGMSGTQVTDWHNNSATTVPIPNRAGSLLPSNGMILHLAAFAYDGVLAHDASLPATVVDLAGINNCAIVGAPKYRTAQTPSGGSAFYGTPPNYVSPPQTAMWSGKTAGHIFCYVKSPSSSGQISGPWNFRAGGTLYTFYPYDDGKVYDGAMTGTRQSWTPTMTVRQVWRVYEVSTSNTTQVARLDGVQQYSGAHPFVAPTDCRILSGMWASSGDTLMAEFFAYDRVLTTTEAASVRSYLVGRHGVTG